MTDTNPLLQDLELPPFEQFEPNQIEPAMTQLIKEGKAKIEEVLASPAPATWTSVIEPIDQQSRRMDNAWAVFSHLNNVKDSAELREAYGKALAMITEYSTWVGQHEGLFKAYKQIEESNEYNELSTAQKETIRQALLGFRLSGIDYPQQKKNSTLSYKTN